MFASVFLAALLMVLLFDLFPIKKSIMIILKKQKESWVLISGQTETDVAKQKALMSLSLVLLVHSFKIALFTILSSVPVALILLLALFFPDLSGMRGICFSLEGFCLFMMAFFIYFSAKRKITSRFRKKF